MRWVVGATLSLAVAALLLSTLLSSMRQISVLWIVSLFSALVAAVVADGMKEGGGG